jgi:hypothetical protein
LNGGVTDSDDLLSFVLVGRSDDGTVGIAVAPARADSRVAFSIGPHAANVGGQVPLRDVLDETGTRLNPMYAEQFTAARCTWVVPYLVRLAEGRNVRESKLVAAFEKRHGYAPEVETQQRFGY